MFTKMEEIICYTENIVSGQCQYISFWDILLDETWANGSFTCPDSVYQMVGGLNQRLHAKQNYEFLLRASLHFPIKAIGTVSPAPTVPISLPEPGTSEVPEIATLGTETVLKTETLGTDTPTMEVPNIETFGTESPETEDWESFRTDCYIVGRYQQDLLEKDYFNLVTATLLEQAAAMPWKEQGIAFLEKMISHAPEFYAIDDNTCPILIYKETDMCYNLLNLFADELARSFLSRRQRVEIFDASVEGSQPLTRYIGQRFKAIIGIQSYLFSIKMQDGTTFLHDLIHGPKYNLIMDHPAWLKEHLLHTPKDYHLLIHDRNYIRFVQRFYPNVSSCLRFPLAGFLPGSDCQEKRYDITFIASYRNYRERLAAIQKYDRRHRFLAARYLRIMRKHPSLPAEYALQEALEHYHITTDDAGFLSLFYDMRQVCFCIMLYYREKIVRTLLDAGLTIHVFGESWQGIPFASHPGLVHHPSAEASQSLRIMQQSRISLNVMSWHKDGLTERVLNAMLCNSAVLTDQSTALAEEFKDNTDILMFPLDRLEQFPGQIKSLLSPENTGRLQEIAENGRKKALQGHLWQHRADMLLKIWDSDTCSV